MNIAEEVRPQFTFDGHGINGPDEYRSRIATFTDHDRAAKYGKQFETALNNHDALVKALENALDRLERVDRIALEATGSPYEIPLFEVRTGREALAAVKKGETP